MDLAWQHNFAERILSPWRDLNAVLCQRIAIQPGRSRAICSAGDLAVGIRHIPEVFGQNPATAKKIERSALDGSKDYRIIRDVGDSWKHKVLRHSSRNASLMAIANFEVSSGRFRFLRNTIQIRHSRFGSSDFLEVSRAAIQFMQGELGLDIGWKNEICEGDGLFHDTAFLKVDPEQAVVFDQVRVRFFQRIAGQLQPLAPSVVHVELV